MSQLSIVLVVLVVSVISAYVFMRWAYRSLKKSGQPDMGYIRYGGLQAIIGMMSTIVATVALVVALSRL